MSLEFKLDTRDFDAALKKYMEGSKREVADAVNRVSFDIVRDAIKLTKRSDKDDIRSLENRPWWKKYIAKRITGGGVIFSVRNRKGESRKVGIHGEYTRAQARSVSTKIIAGRIKARAFLAAGWLRPTQQLARKIFGSGARTRAPGDTKQYGRPKGIAYPATNSWEPTCRFLNSAMSAISFSSKPNPRPVAFLGLQMAFRRKAVDLRHAIVRRLEKLSKKHFKR